MHGAYPPRIGARHSPADRFHTDLADVLLRSDEEHQPRSGRRLKTDDMFCKPPDEYRMAVFRQIPFHAIPWPVESRTAKSCAEIAYEIDGSTRFPLDAVILVLQILVEQGH